MHRPAAHASPVVQRFPSSHADPSALGIVVQTPVAGLQTPASWQTPVAVHTTGAAPTQIPPVHASICVQALPSSHGVPSARAVTPQMPVAGLQAPGR
jgi:hypothetical protein